MSLFRSGVACALLWVSFGCAGTADRKVLFHDTQRRYTQLMRFTDFEKAGRYVVPDQRRAFRERTAALGDLRFTDYEVQEVETNGDSAVARVEYFGYRASSPIVVTYVEEQHWELAGATWQVRPNLEESRP